MADEDSSTGGCMTKDWRTYYDKAGLGAPRPTLLRALETFATEGMASGHAIDLGCGVGRDALELLCRGWSVTGIDAEAEALDRLAAEARARGLPAPALVRSTFEAADLPTCDLVNSSFALFFCAPAAFPDLWARIRAALPPGGRFAGQLLGPSDSSAAPPRRDGPRPPSARRPPRGLRGRAARPRGDRQRHPARRGQALGPLASGPAPPPDRQGLNATKWASAWRASSLSG